MKKKYLFLSLFAALAFVSCSSEDDGITNGNENVSDGAPRYLSVSINSVGSVSRTRATEGLAGEYEAGIGIENGVTAARFYFFDESGNAANVKAGATQNFLDAEPKGDASDMNNVENILNATLVISTKEGDELPASVLAVLNPTEEIKKMGTMGLTQLNNVISDYSSTATANFLMSNSVYAKASMKMEAVDVTKHIYKTEASALADPVSIHVERVLAKARLTLAASLDKKELDGGKTIYKALKANKTDVEKYENKDIYVKFLGWNVTATAGTSRLMKEINESWSDNLFGTTPELKWNTTDYCRSFWAVNPSQMTYGYGNFTDAQTIKAFDGGTEQAPQTNYTYLQENASDNKAAGTNPVTPSKVIIAAQLVDENGSALSIAEHGTERMLSSDLAGYYARLSGLWKANDTGRVQMEASDVVFYTDADEHGNITQQGTADRYKVYAKLADGVTADWYGSSDGNDVTKVDANVRLKGLGSSKVLEGGNTYYYFEIRHLNSAADDDTAIGKYGVVRNHVYAANITSLVGLGTPVYDPNEVIYPEKPSDDDSYIAAEIRILSWRIVNSDIELE